MKDQVFQARPKSNLKVEPKLFTLYFSHIKADNILKVKPTSPIWSMEESRCLWSLHEMRSYLPNLGA